MFATLMAALVGIYKEIAKVSRLEVVMPHNMPHDAAAPAVLALSL